MWICHYGLIKFSEEVSIPIWAMKIEKLVSSNNYHSKIEGLNPVVFRSATNQNRLQNTILITVEIAAPFTPNAGIRNQLLIKVIKDDKPMPTIVKISLLHIFKINPTEPTQTLNSCPKHNIFIAKLPCKNAGPNHDKSQSDINIKKAVQGAAIKTTVLILVLINLWISFFCDECQYLAMVGPMAILVAISKNDINSAP